MPTMGAVTFAIVHASAICAIFASFFFASSSTLCRSPCQHKRSNRETGARTG